MARVVAFMQGDIQSLDAAEAFLLRVSERAVAIPEIAGFLSAHGLLFRGFHLAPDMFGLFEERFPGAAWPGSLAQWAEFEEEHPLFDGMYTFWCTRA